MEEVLPGLFHWTALHEPIGLRVSSYYEQPAGIVIDPKVPEEGLASLPGRPQAVVLTSGHHTRDSQAFADAYGIPIRASREAADYVGDELEVEPYGENDEVAPGMTIIHIGQLCADEGALHVAVAEGAIAVADGIHRYDQDLSFFADDLLGDDPERVKQGLRQAYRGLLSREFDHLLFAHGEPLIGGGKAALRDFVAVSP